MKKLSSLYYLLGGFLFAVVIYFFGHGIPLSYNSGQAAQHLIHLAESEYREGEISTQVADRKKAFNLALSHYLQLEKNYHPNYGNGKLYYNIGNAYFQLGEYPLAVYFYEKSLSLDPRDNKTISNLATTLDKLGLNRPTTGFKLDNIFFFHSYLSLPERLTLFFFFSLLAFLFLSLIVWHRRRLLQSLAILFGISALILLGSIFYSQFISPMEAIVVKPAFLYRDAGDQYAKVAEKPLTAGEKIQVLDLKGEWLKVLTPSGELGFIKSNSLRII